MAKNSNSAVDVRINRLIGQIEGVRRMIYSKRRYDETIQQILAARQALSRLGILVCKEAILKTPSKQKRKLEELIEKIFNI